MDALRSTASTTTTSSLEATSSQGSRSNLTLPDSITRRLDELNISSSTASPQRTTCRPRLNIDDIPTGLDRVDLSLTECISMSEAALHRPDDPVTRPIFGLGNGASIYSDQIRASMECLCVIDLTRSSVEQIQSEMTLGSNISY